MSFFDGQPDLLLVSRVPVMQRVLAMVEGVAAARRLLAPHAVTVSTMNSLSRIARDLAAAAQDCEALSVFAAPLELVPAEDLLLAGLCRLGRGELDEALVLVEAAQVYASDELASAENARLLEAVREQARFWLEAAPAPAPVTPVSAGPAREVLGADAWGLGDRGRRGAAFLEAIAGAAGAIALLEVAVTVDRARGQRDLGEAPEERQPGCDSPAHQPRAARIEAARPGPSSRRPGTQPTPKPRPSTCGMMWKWTWKLAW